MCVYIYIVGIISFFEHDVDSYEEFYYKVENMMALRVLRKYDKKDVVVGVAGRRRRLATAEALCCASCVRCCVLGRFSDLIIKL
jgi:hypothetical protein